MAWVLALVAFAGVMTILSTIVTVVVELIHKVFSMRKTGLQEMLRALHDNVIQDLEEGRPHEPDLLQRGGRSKNAAAFAKAMTASPAYGGGGRWWWPANWRLIGVFQRRFERLSRRQFAEQLAQTEYGRRLAAQDRDAVRRALATSIYEFDRYGVAQTDFFRRRAKVFSAIAAFAFAVLANVNAPELYLHLATNDASLRQTLSLLDDADLDGQIGRAQAAQAAIDEQIARLEQADGEGNVAALEDQRETAYAVRGEIVEIVDTLSGDSRLPIGRRYFPYCLDPLADVEQCGGGAGLALAGGAPQAAAAGGPAWLSPTIWRLATSPGDGFIWLVSMIATAGLLGLGAPFWFNLYSKAGAVVGLAASRRMSAPPPGAGEAAIPVSAPTGARGSEEPTLEESVDAFLIASGKPPELRPAGPGGGGGAPPVRRVRGDWSGSV
ncbi:MAG: hypothetical protein MI723_18360 [Caulobacterales bacterium]|nr:hypothetical protein [Caulobacterales bacterium]